MGEYADRDVIQLDRDGGYYCRHVAAMTAEGLHSKADIAAELAWRDREIDRLKATHPQPVTPAGGEVEKLIALLEDVAVQHEGLESYGDSCGPRMCIRACRGAIAALRSHPHVADAALVELIDEALEQMELHGMHALREYKELKARHRLMDAALNQRGGGCG